MTWTLICLMPMVLLAGFLWGDAVGDKRVHRNIFRCAHRGTRYIFKHGGLAWLMSVEVSEVRDQ